MHIQTTYIGTPDDLKAVLEGVIKPLSDRIRELEIQLGSKKHLYTVSEVAEQLSYSTKLVRQFIREGKRDRKGNLIYLKTKDITSGDYRIAPEAISEFLSHF